MAASAWVAPPTDDVGTVTTANVRFLADKSDCELIIPHIPVWEKSDRQDGIFSRSDFHWDSKRGAYICPNGKLLQTSGTVHDGRRTLSRDGR
jgi:hypothetical protein